MGWKTKHANSKRPASWPASFGRARVLLSRLQSRNRPPVTSPQRRASTTETTEKDDKVEWAIQPADGLICRLSINLPYRVRSPGPPGEIDGARHNRVRFRLLRDTTFDQVDRIDTGPWCRSLLSQSS
jgi:hypothetical protein